ncbi:polyprenyl synthetase family protein [Vampirovibrio chlorellavorus]|uniref:polyprenyl synthetase family protein n=1 Tax=Vampirovibrio chlorellavorus TaxID=758823 RepID=UPI0026F1B38F|nr:polyprenyl synthetase family protein [Vampirovibrio chlorellavorus]
MSSLLSPTLQQAFDLILAPLNSVKDNLKAIIPPQSAVLAETVEYSLLSGGKYLRPVVTLLCAQASKPQSASEIHQAVEASAVAEMIHVATLLHDDVIDGSELRRGRKTVRAQWGNKISILSGDYLLAQASVKLAKLGNPRLVSIFAHVLADLCDGEVEQMNSSYHLDTAWDSYYRKTMCKTASLFSAGCESAGVINGLPEAQIQALKSYGHHFGIAFQVADDLLDYTATEAEMGKPVLDDLRNGLLTAPILLALESEKLSAEAQAELKQLTTQLFETPSDETLIQKIQDYLTKADAVAGTQRLADQYVEKAKQSLDFLPDSEAKTALINLAEFIPQRRA